MQRTMCWTLVVFSVTTLVLCRANRAWACWNENGTAVCIATGHQKTPEIVGDGAGGAIITWMDDRKGAGDFDIYARRIDACGDTLWAAEGVALCDHAGNQMYPAIVSDGAGGAIVAWQDARGSDINIYAQRVDGSGAVQWRANGVALCGATGDQVVPRMVSDGAGGAIVIWIDHVGLSHIYARRVTAAGEVRWGLGTGVSVHSLGQGEDVSHAMVSDGAGGAIVAWEFEYNGNHKVYAQRLDSTGVTLWIPARLVCNRPTWQWDMLPVLASDGAGGAIVSWTVSPWLGAQLDIRVRRVDASGDTLWAAGGVVLCDFTGDQFVTSIVSDGTGGAIAAWMDNRGGPENLDIYAGAVDDTGAVKWAEDGVAVCTAVGDQRDPRIVTDGVGGAIAAWQDYRSGVSNQDIYAQRLDASGVTLWADDGVAMCRSLGLQLDSKIASDGVGGALVAWEDRRNGIGESDIYAHRVNAGGCIDAPDVDRRYGNILFQNVPNPFWRSTRIAFSTVREDRVRLEIFDASGRLVRVLVDEMRQPRHYIEPWDGRDGSGRPVAPGVYFYRIRTPGWYAAKKMALAR